MTNVDFLKIQNLGKVAWLLLSFSGINNKLRFISQKTLKNLHKDHLYMYTIKNRLYESVAPHYPYPFSISLILHQHFFIMN